MTTQDKVKVIAEYDGWKDDMHNMYVNDKYNKGTLMYLSDMKYLTSLDWLHPVAIKVYSEIIDCKYNDISDITDICTTINLAIMYKPIKGEYIALFNAVYDGIVFLNSNK